jgi:membrane-bound lytic murein transglycosylase D
MTSRGLILSLLFVVGLISEYAAQNPSSESDSVYAITPDDPVLVALDRAWSDLQKERQNFSADSVELNVYGFPFDSIPNYPDSTYASRLRKLDEQTPLELTYNNYVRAYINVYTHKRRDITKHVLGMAALYYPMFEAHLDKYDMPLELKHLAVVESALKPDARSPVGATGLWQFMYGTGKIYGLEVNSFIDERRDPLKSTEAACRYMKWLYERYGDWNLVLAAYNSGPGNVNKAIRRSGGRRDYWEIRRYLPRETRGYVPAFIAVNYIMNHAAEHNLYPIEPPKVHSEVDTLMICRRTTFDQIARFTETTLEELEYLNPSIKRNIIPNSGDCHALYLPVEAAGLFLANEDSLYNYQPDAPQAVDGYIVEDVVEHYVVRSGDVLGVIAERYGVSLSHLREWNHLRGNRIYPGQRLEIHKTIKTKVGEETAKADEPEKKVDEAGENSEEKKTVDGDPERFHVVQRGDTLWDIAKLYPGVSINDIKSANSNIDYRRLRPGQKIKIPPSL